MDAKAALEFFGALMDGCSVDSLDAYDPIECRTYISQAVHLRKMIEETCEAENVSLDFFSKLPREGFIGLACAHIFAAMNENERTTLRLKESLCKSLKALDAAAREKEEANKNYE